MHLVIPLLNSRGAHLELRYALRSITSHHSIERCILVGGKPDWYTGEHLAHPDYTAERKEENIRDKTIAAAQLINGKFLFANDDHILLAPITETYNKGKLSVTIPGRLGNGSYTRCLKNTLAHYGDVYNADCHCPMFMDSEKVKKTFFPWPEYGLCFKTAYCEENKIQSVMMEDAKVDAIPNDRPWFSLSENFRVHTLQDLYWNPCKFEKEFYNK